ncbi:MAG: hypothetical protein ACFFAS_10320 [Promethearchaeota archaeon]
MCSFKLRSREEKSTFMTDNTCSFCGLSKNICTCEIVVQGEKAIVIGYEKLLSSLSDVFKHECNFQVIICGNIHQAIEILEHEYEEIAFILIDINNTSKYDCNIVKNLIEDNQYIVVLTLSANKHDEISMSKIEFTD